MMGHDDQRNYFRMLINTEVRLDIEDPESNREITGICRDLSASGMALEVDEEVMAGTCLTARLEANSMEIPSLQAKAKVIRCTPEGDAYVLGVEILEMS